MRVQLTRNHGDDGAIAILVAVLAVLFAVIAAFVTDFGTAYAQRQALSTGADSAALAIVRNEQLRVVANPVLTCGQLVTDDSATASATALTQINSNAPFGSPLTAGQVTTTLQCVGSNQGTLQATVTVNKTVPTTFGAIVGARSIAINRTAAAALGAANTVGITPIAVCTNQALAIVNRAVSSHSPYAHELISLTKVWKAGNDCGSGGAGNWGFLDCTGNGAPSLSAGIQDGCNNGLTLDTSTTPATYAATGTPGNKGNSNPVQTAMGTIMDQVRVLPVYSSVTGNGANATYTVVGFLSVRICGYESNSKQQTGTCYLNGIDPVSKLDVTLTSDSLQVVYDGFTPAAAFNLNCAIGDTSCAFNAYKTGLIR